MADDSTATTDAPGDGSSEEIVPAEPTDERREAILEYVFGEAEVDLEEFPNVDLTRAAQGNPDEAEPEVPGSGGDEPQSVG